MDMSTLKNIAAFFRQYQNEAAFQNLHAARAFLGTARTATDGSYEQKILCARVFFELMQSCENVIRLLRVVHEFPKRNPIENLLDRDLSHFQPKNAGRRLSSTAVAGLSSTPDQVRGRPTVFCARSRSSLRPAHHRIPSTT